MSTVSSSTTNPYLVSYSLTNVMDDPLLNSTKSGNSSSTTSSSSSSSSSGSYSSSLVSQMSGLDVTSMVNESMTGDYTQLNNLLSKKQTSQWTQDRYRSIISNLDSFSNQYFMTGASDNVTSASGYVLNATSSSNSTTATITASNAAKQGNYSLTVTNVASATNMSYAATGTNGESLAKNGITNSSSLSSLLTVQGITVNSEDKLNFTVNGNSVTYDLSQASSVTVSQFMNQLTSMSGMNGAVFGYSELTGKTSVSNTNFGANDLTISSSDANTQTVLNKLFGTSLSGTSGSTTTATVSASTTNSGLAASVATSVGSEANFKITEPDGSSNTVTESSNNFTIDGVTYSVSNGAAAGSTVTLNVSQDTSSIVSKLQDFVDAYNNMITGLNTAVTEKKDYTYKPLTSAQQSQMTDSAITAWNQKAQQGLLQNDDIVSGLMSSMRTALYTPVKGVSLTMGDIGLSTSDDPTDGGKLSLNTTKLTNALKSNPQGVIDLLTKTSTSVPVYSTTLTNTQIATKSSEEGIFQRLWDIKQQYSNDVMSDGILVNKAGKTNSTDTSSALYNELKDESDSISQFELRVNQDKTRYTTQFTNLQTAMSQLSSQQSYLSSMLSSSSSN